MGDAGGARVPASVRLPLKRKVGQWVVAPGISSDHSVHLGNSECQRLANRGCRTARGSNRDYMPGYSSGSSRAVAVRIAPHLFVSSRRIGDAATNRSQGRAIEDARRISREHRTHGPRCTHGDADPRCHVTGDQFSDHVHRQLPASERICDAIMDVGPARVEGGCECPARQSQGLLAHLMDRPIAADETCAT